MSFGISRRARSKKAKAGLRSLLGKAPDAKEVGMQLVFLAKRLLGGAVTDTTTRRVTLQLHPEASPVTVLVLPDGDLEVKGETASIGPGYHAAISEALAPVLAELDFVWDANEPDPKTAMTAWLAAELAAGATRIGIPSALAFKLDAAVLTPMGPRDAAWRDAVIADPARGADAFAWWEAGPGRAEYAAALLAMWLRMPWREPVDGEERELMEGINVALRAARKAELAVPYAEWADLRSYLGGNPEKIADLRAQAGGAPSTIGYRRYPIELEVGAWTLELPGTFVGSFEDERYWATDGDRLVELTTLTTNGQQTSPQLLDVAPAAHEIVERITEAARAGRAESYVTDEVHIMHGIMAATPEVAILTCKGTSADLSWALGAWRSLRTAT